MPMFGAEEVYGAPESWFWGVIFCSSGTDVRVLIINGQPFLPPTWHPQNYPVIRDRPVAEGRFLFLFSFFFSISKIAFFFFSFFFFFLSFLLFSISKNVILIVILLVSMEVQVKKRKKTFH